MKEELTGLERHTDRNLNLILGACQKGSNQDLLRQVERILEERKLKLIKKEGE